VGQRICFLCLNWNAISGKGERQMQYLVQMKLVPQGRPAASEEGTAFIEHYIFPTLELCKKLQDEKKILAGGPMSSARLGAGLGTTRITQRTQTAH
jgi:hypothetical protein